MNILADEQRKILGKNVNEEEQEKYLNLYYKTLKKDENSFLGKLSLKMRKKLHKYILVIFVIKNWISGYCYNVIKDEREKTERPIIFALTHVGKYDIEVAAVAIKEHFYLLSGDYEHLQGTVDGTFLLINGVIYFNEKVKKDRIEVTNRMINHLKAGGNLMYFPEGTWNLKPELPVLPCYWGIVNVAQKSNAIIIPVAIEQYGKRFKINIGKNFDMQTFGSSDTEKIRAITSLRDVLATLKYEIWETEPKINRCKINGYEWQKYIAARLAEWPYFSLEYIEEMIYKPNNHY